jgi:O-acetyl-ADP-ribose deacetylase (regulator of RNase III)
MSLTNIKFYIVDKQRDVINAFCEHFQDLSNVEIIRGDIESVKNVDCIVAGNNSYALMNSGVDKKINLLLNNIQPKIKNIIESSYFGELLVGNCILVKTNISTYKYLAYCPNMRLQKNVNITHNAYIAFRSLLTNILNHNKFNDDKITSVLLTGFCTGSGKMDPNKSGKQMRLAYGFINININCSIENAKIIDKLLE